MTIRTILNKNEQKFKMNFLLKKLLVDTPGMIVYNDNGVFGGNNVKMRMAFMFEESIRKLYHDTIKKIGQDNTDMLWYKAGKDVAFRYFSKHRNLRNIIISKKAFIKELGGFSSFFMGMNFFNKMDVEFEKGRFTFYLKDIHIKKEFHYPFLSGIVSGFLSYSLNKNIEATFFYGDESHEYRITGDVSFEDIYIPEKKTIKEFSGHSTDFLLKNRISSGLCTFSDLLKFKVIKINESECIILKEKVLLPFEFGTPSIFFKNYEKIGELNLFKKSLVNSSEKICADLLRNKKSKKEKVRIIRNILSAIGLMEIYFTRDKDMVTVSFLRKVFILEKPSFIHLFINGFLNHLHRKKVKLVFESQDKFRYKI